MSARKERAAQEIDHLAYVLRGRDGPETRSARLGDNRFDFFRGKDFYRVLRERVDVLDEYCAVDERQRREMEADAAKRDEVNAMRIKHCGACLLQRGYIVRCEREIKHARSGRVKLVKFPHYLMRTRDQTFVEDAFYAWTYEMPMSWKSVVLSGLFAVLVVAMCLFPLAPIWFKKLILYVCVGILVTFAVLFTVRLVVFVAVWIFTGEHFWLLPNLTDDTVPINEIFSPMWAFDVEAKKIGLAQRFVSLTVGGALVYGLYSYAPETGGAVANLNRAHDSILDLFNLKDGPKSLGGGANATANATMEANATVEIEVNATVVDDANATNATNATAIPSLDEILAEVGEMEDDEEEQGTRDEL